MSLWLGALFGGFTMGVALAAIAAKRSTEGFRKEHSEMGAKLDRMAADVGALEGAPAHAQKRIMESFVSFMRQQVLPHAGWEDAVLYPLVDRHAGSAERPYTDSMRHEHKIVVRWVNELARTCAAPAPDAGAFARRADNLLGLVRAHLEIEEEVLLPILDAKLTPDELDRALRGDP